MQRTTKPYQCHPWRWMLPVFVFLCCDKSLAINIDVAFADVTSDSKIVLVNLDDDDGNGQPDKDQTTGPYLAEDDLQEINVSVQVGDDYNGKVTISVEEPSSGGPRAKLWTDGIKTLPLPDSWDVTITNGVLQPVKDTKPVKFFVEGIKESATTDDVVIKATLSNGDVDEVKLTLLPVEITVAFGEGPTEIPNGSDLNSRELLEAYLNVIKVARQGDIWAVKGKDAQGNDKIWGVEIVNDQAKLNAALSSAGRHVVFDGHYNYGFGPDFLGSDNIMRVSDFTNYGAKYTDVQLTFRKLLRNPQNPNDPANFGDDYGNLEIPDGEIAVMPTNYKPLPINEERFPNMDMIGENQVFPKQGEGFETWHFRINGGSKRLMINAPKTDLPTNLAYNSFFYNACSSGIDYVENFKHGDFIYTKKSCFVHEGTKIFVQGVVEGKTTAEIIPTLNVQSVGSNNEGEIIYSFESF